MKKREKEAQKQTLIQMAIRELLMGYYKNSSHGSLLWVSSGIRLRDMPTETQFQYQRQLREMRKHSSLVIGATQVAELLKNPSAFVITVDEHRSQQMLELFEGLNTFIKAYLPSVKIEHKPASLGQVDDSNLTVGVEVSVRSMEEIDGGDPRVVTFNPTRGSWDIGVLDAQEYTEYTERTTTSLNDLARMAEHDRILERMLRHNEGLVTLSATDRLEPLYVNGGAATTDREHVTSDDFMPF